MSKKTPAGKSSGKQGRTRRTSLFPAASFEEALMIANGIKKRTAEQKVGTLTLFN